MWLKFGVLIVVLLTSCSGDDSPVETEDDLRFDPVQKTPNGQNGNENNENNENNTENNLNNANNAECGVPVCTMGEARCAGADIENCVPDFEGCLGWERSGCSNDEVCFEGACTEAADCIDTDGDGFGDDCPAGPDCDDTNRDINPNAAEMCDNVDNDCDTQIDEDYAIGQPCSMGQGMCAADGFTSCAPDGASTMCDATPVVGDPEVCDGQDNDCNGMVDDGDVCAFCNADPNEPNNVVADASPIAEGSRGWLSVCPGDVDWFVPTVTPGQEYRFSIKFPELVSDIRVDGYINGQMVASADGFSDDEALVFTAVQGDTYAFEIVNKGTEENAYFVNFTDTTNLGCSGEDAFGPNYAIGTAPLFFPTWWTESAICFNTTDWYRMEGVQQNDTISIDVDAISFTDFDLYLWADIDGDNTFDVLDSANGIGDSEFIVITAPYTGTYFYEVRAPGDVGYYETRWQH